MRTSDPKLEHDMLDQEDYFGPLHLMHSASFHAWGVAYGLEVEAKATGVQVGPGVALDVEGRTIVLAPGGRALTDLDPAKDLYEHGATYWSSHSLSDLPAVTTGGILLPTTGLSGDYGITIQFMEFLATDKMRMYQTPWLRLRLHGELDESMLVLAEVTIGANGTVTALSERKRQLAGLPAGSLTLRRPMSGTSSLSVGQTDAAELRPRADGGLDISLSQSQASLHVVGGLQLHGNAVLQGTLTVNDNELDLPDLQSRLSQLESAVSRLESSLKPRFVNPSLPQFEPATGGIGQNITLNGTNFDIGTIQVQFDTIDATIIGRPTALQIVVQVPPGLTPDGLKKDIRIRVTTSGGSVTSDQAFTVQPNPVFGPIGSQFSPTSGYPGQNVTLHGYNFNATIGGVLFGDVTAPIVSLTATQIVVRVPTRVYGNVNITVKTSEGQIVSDDSFAAPALGLLNYYDEVLNANHQLEIKQSDLSRASGRDISLAIMSNVEYASNALITHFVAPTNPLSSGWSPLQTHGTEQDIGVSTGELVPVVVNVRGAQAIVGETGVITVYAQVWDFVEGVEIDNGSLPIKFLVAS